MIELDIPSYGKLTFQQCICDFNGTLASSGILNSKIKELIEKLAQSLKIYVITGDTFSTAKDQLSNIPCETIIAPQENQAKFKENFLINVGNDKSVAIGNGRNDAKMLKAAALGIAVFNGEGIATEALTSADIVVEKIEDAFEMLINPKKIIATLRG